MKRNNPLRPETTYTEYHREYYISHKQELKTKAKARYEKLKVLKLKETKGANKNGK